MSTAPELARLSDVGALVAMRDDIAEWLTAKGIEQWISGEFPTERMAAWIETGAVHVSREDGRPVAAVAVLWEDPDIWGEDAAEAGYIHLLMVDRDHAGQALGDRLLGHAEDTIRRQGRAVARLDAVSTNSVLLDWYRERGYRTVGTRSFEGTPWYDTVLMEKPLG